MYAWHSGLYNSHLRSQQEGQTQQCRCTLGPKLQQPNHSFTIPYHPNTTPAPQPHHPRRRFLDPSDKARIERLELFDEYEEWLMIQEHYSISMAGSEEGREGGLMEEVAFEM